MKKLLAVSLLMSSASFAADEYRKMTVVGATIECAKSFSASGTGATMLSVAFSGTKKELVVSYAMPGDTTDAERQAIRDKIKAEILAACGKAPDEFVTIQKGEKLTTAADSR